MPNNNNGGNTWSSTIRGRAVKGNKLFEYILQTLRIPNGGASNQSPFDYSLHPVSLTVKESFLPTEDYTQQKVASVSSMIDEEVRKDRIRAAYNAAENNDHSLVGPTGRAVTSIVESTSEPKEADRSMQRNKALSTTTSMLLFQKGMTCVASTIIISMTSSIGGGPILVRQ